MSIKNQSKFSVWHSDSVPDSFFSWMYIFVKVNFEKSQQIWQQKHEKLPCIQRVKALEIQVQSRKKKTVKIKIKAFTLFVNFFSKLENNIIALFFSIGANYWLKM